MRASALTLCSYIEGLTGSGATATVKTRSSWATARLRVGVSPAKRWIIRNLRLLHERSRRRQMQRKRIDLVAGARIDLAHDRIVTRDETIGMTGQPLDDFPALRHVADIVDNRKRA